MQAKLFKKEEIGLHNREGRDAQTDTNTAIIYLTKLDVLNVSSFKLGTHFKSFMFPFLQAQ